jgi:hypothetical protein
MAKTLILDDEDPYQRCVRGREKHKVFETEPVRAVMKL